MISFNELLILFWILSSLLILIFGLCTLYVCIPVPNFIQTLIFYGKFGSLKLNSCQNQPELKKFTKHIDSIISFLQVPKSWFRHFYVCSFIINIFIITRIKQEFLNFSNCLLILVQFIQSCRRMFETIKISIYSGNFVFHFRKY